MQVQSRQVVPHRRSALPTTIAAARAQVDYLPDAQRRIFFLMCDFWAENDQLPAMKTIAQRMGYRSVNAAQVAVLALEKKGFLERNESQRLRFIRVEGLSLGEVFRREVANSAA